MPFQCLQCQHICNKLGKVGCLKHGYKFPNENDTGAKCGDLSLFKEKTDVS